MALLYSTKVSSRSPGMAVQCCSCHSHVGRAVERVLAVELYKAVHGAVHEPLFQALKFAVVADNAAADCSYKTCMVDLTRLC